MADFKGLLKELSGKTDKDIMAKAVVAIQQAEESIESRIPDLLAYRDSIAVEYESVQGFLEQYRDIVRDELSKESLEYSVAADLRQKYEGLLVQQQAVLQELEIIEDVIGRSMLMGSKEFWTHVPVGDALELLDNQEMVVFSGEDEARM